LHGWGRQVGAQAALIPNNGGISTAQLEVVAIRKRVYNPRSAALLGIRMPDGFEAVPTR
jgi:hypothetical protein